MRRFNLPSLFGPIVAWELTSTARRKRYYVLRALYVLILMLLLYLAYAGAFAAPSIVLITATGEIIVQGPAARETIAKVAEFSRSFFVLFGYAQLTAVLVLTPAYVTGAIAVEKQRRTIELLAATDLTYREIVLGKLAARTLNALTLVLAGVPMPSFASWLGGIDLRSLLLLTLLTMSTLIVTASIAIWASVVGRSMADAAMLAYSVVAILLLSPLVVAGSVEIVGPFLARREPMIAGAEALRSPIVWLCGILQLAEPYFCFSWLRDDGGFLNALSQGGGLLFAIAAHAVLACILLVASILKLRRLVESDQAEPVNRERRRRRVGQNPMLWKAWRVTDEGSWSKILVLCALALFYFLFLLAIVRSIDAGDGPHRIFSTLGLGEATLFLAVYAMIAVRAASCIHAERSKGTWDSLIATPLSGREIVDAKVIYAWKPLLWLVVGLLPSWLISVALGAMSAGAIPPLLIVSAAYGHWLAALGVYHALRRSSLVSAVSDTLAAAMFFGVGGLLPWGMLYFCFAAGDSRFIVGVIPISLFAHVIPAQMLIGRTIRRFDELVARATHDGAYGGAVGPTPRRAG